MNRSIVVLALVVLCLSVATPTPALAPDPVSPAGPRVTTEEAFKAAEAVGRADPATATEPFIPIVSIRLPVVMNNYRGESPCSLDSPFSLEIAAIHQISPAGGQAVTAEAEAAWLARYEEGFPTLVEAFEESGACWTRIEISWDDVQPDSPATYDWSFFDEKLGLLAETGVHIIAIIDKVPDWAGPHERGPIDANRLDEFQAFLTAVVNRYKGQPYDIHHWELFNEADWVDDVDPDNVGWGFNADRYAHMLENHAYPAIKGADPGATILMGGLAYDAFEEYRHLDPPCTTCPFHRYFPDDVIAAGGAPYFDALNIHYFPDYHLEWEQWNTPPLPTCGAVYDGVGTTYDGSGVDLIAKTNHFRTRLSTCMGLTDKPIWVTELGEHGVEGDDESLAQQSRYVLKGYARGLAAGVKNITWFVLVSPDYDDYDQGLLYKIDWSPKPAYYTYQTLTHELAGYQYNHTIVSDGVEGYVFRRPLMAAKAVAWSNREGFTAPLTFSPASRLVVVDRLGGETLIVDGGPGDRDGAVNGEVRIRLTNDPVIVLH